MEMYAMELKKLYNNAHAHRDPQTKEGDLLCSFMDGLANDKLVNMWNL